MESTLVQRRRAAWALTTILLLATACDRTPSPDTPVSQAAPTAMPPPPRGWADAVAAETTVWKDEGSRAGLYRGLAFIKEDGGPDSCTYVVLYQRDDPAHGAVVGARFEEATQEPCGSWFEGNGDSPSAKVQYLAKVLPGLATSAASDLTAATLSAAPASTDDGPRFRVPSGEGCREVLLRVDGDKVRSVRTKQTKDPCPAG